MNALQPSDSDVNEYKESLVRPETPPIIPLLGDLQKMLVEKYKVLGESVDRFSESSSVIEIAKILRLYYKSENTHKSECENDLLPMSRYFE